jgi:hypothetical protein
MMHWTMLSYGDIILLGEERVLVIQEHKDSRCWCRRPGIQRLRAKELRHVQSRW